MSAPTRRTAQLVVSSDAAEARGATTARPSSARSTLASWGVTDAQCATFERALREDRRLSIPFTVHSYRYGMPYSVMRWEGRAAKLLSPSGSGFRPVSTLELAATVYLVEVFAELARA